MDVCGAGVSCAGVCCMDVCCTADAIIGAGLNKAALVSPRTMALVARAEVSGAASTGPALASGKRSAMFCEAVSSTVRSTIVCQLPTAYPTMPAAISGSHRPRFSARLRRIRTPPFHPASDGGYFFPNEA